MKKSIICVFFLACMSFAVSEPAAQEAQDSNALARQSYEQGISHYENGDYKAAATAFREAYTLRPSWKILFNIGQSEAAAKRYGLAMEAFQKYLIKGGDDIPGDRKDYVTEEIRRLKELVGEVEVDAPEKSAVYIDGVLRGTAPLLSPVLVVGGTRHEAVVKLEKDELLRREFSVWGGKKIKLVAQKKPEKAPGPAPVAVAEKPEPEEEQEEAGPEEETQQLDPLYFWLSLGATAAFGGATLAVEFVVKDKYEQYEEKGDSSIKDEGRTLQPVGIAFLALTGAAAVATGVLAYFTFAETGDAGEAGETGDDSDTARIHVAPWAGTGSGGLMLEMDW